MAQTGPRGHRIGSGDPLLLIHGLAHPPRVWGSVLLPSVELRTLHDVGHVPMLDDPKGVASVIRDFAAGR